MLTRKSIKRIYFISIIIYILEICTIFAFFRKLRSLFPPPDIGKTDTVGVVQYLGYPLNFETILFFSMFLSPFFIIFVVTFLYKKYNE